MCFCFCLNFFQKQKQHTSAKTTEADSNDDNTEQDKPKKNSEARLATKSTKDKNEVKSKVGMKKKPEADKNQGTGKDEITLKTGSSKKQEPSENNIRQMGVECDGNTSMQKSAANKSRSNIRHDKHKSGAKPKKSIPDENDRTGDMKPDKNAVQDKNAIQDKTSMKKTDDRKETGAKTIKVEEQGVQDETGAAKFERGSEGGKQQKHSKNETPIQDAAQESEKIVWDSDIKLVKCSVVLKRLSASEISRYCQRTSIDEVSRVESAQGETVDRPGPVSSKVKAKRKRRREMIASETSSDSEDMPLSAHVAKSVKVKRKRSKGDVASSAHQRLPSFDSSSDDEELHENEQKKSEKIKKSQVGEKSSANTLKRKPRLSSSDSSSDIEELQRSEPSKIRKKHKGIKLKRNLPPDSSTDSEGSQKGTHSMESVKGASKPKAKNTPEVRSKAAEVRKKNRTQSTEDSVFADSKNEKGKPDGQKKRNPSTASESSRTNVRDKPASNVVKQKGTGHKKGRPSHSGSSITSPVNIKSQQDDKKGEKKRSSSVSSNPDAKQIVSSANLNASETSHSEKPQSGSRRDSVVDVDIADILFKDSYSLKPTKRTVSKAKEKKTGDSNKPK